MMEVSSQRLVVLLLPIFHLFPRCRKVELGHESAAICFDETLPVHQDSASRGQPVLGRACEVAAGHLQFECLRPVVDSCSCFNLVQPESRFLGPGLTIKVANGPAEVRHHVESSSVGMSNLLEHQRVLLDRQCHLLDQCNNICCNVTLWTGHLPFIRRFCVRRWWWRLRRWSTCLVISWGSGCCSGIFSRVWRRCPHAWWRRNIQIRWRLCEHTRVQVT